ncbi:hypothetical protein SAMN05518866_10156 [Sphingobium sp. YR768]|nr:hypothetical protein SAMN05518866_10156 [Sphingobium sp. YR768]
MDMAKTPGASAPLRSVRPIGEASPAYDLLPRIEKAIRLRNWRPTRFGRRATGDPRLVFDIRNGRKLREDTRLRILALLARLEAQPSADSSFDPHLWLDRFKQAGGMVDVQNGVVVLACPLTSTAPVRQAERGRLVEVVSQDDAKRDAVCTLILDMAKGGAHD